MLGKKKLKEKIDSKGLFFITSNLQKKYNLIHGKMAALALKVLCCGSFEGTVLQGAIKCLFELFWNPFELYKFRTYFPVI